MKKIKILVNVLVIEKLAQIRLKIVKNKQVNACKIKILRINKNSNNRPRKIPKINKTRMRALIRK